MALKHRLANEQEQRMWECEAARAAVAQLKQELGGIGGDTEARA